VFKVKGLRTETKKQGGKKKKKVEEETTYHLAKRKGGEEKFGLLGLEKRRNVTKRSEGGRHRYDFFKVVEKRGVAGGSRFAVLALA